MTSYSELPGIYKLYLSFSACCVHFSTFQLFVFTLPQVADKPGGLVLDVATGLTYIVKKVSVSYYI